MLVRMSVSKPKFGRRGELLELDNESANLLISRGWAQRASITRPAGNVDAEPLPPVAALTVGPVELSKADLLAVSKRRGELLTGPIQVAGRKFEYGELVFLGFEGSDEGHEGMFHGVYRFRPSRETDADAAWLHPAELPGLPAGVHEDESREPTAKAQ